MKKTSKLVLSLALAVMMVLTSFTTVFASEYETRREATENNKAVGTIIQVDNGYKPTDIVDVIVELEGAPLLDVNGVGDVKLEANLLVEQESARKKISNELFNGENFEIINNYTVILNGFAFQTEYQNIEKINNMPGMKAHLGVVYNQPETVEYNEPQMGNSTSMVGADIAWNTLGYTGKGTVSCVIDTGADLDHEAFNVMPPEPKISWDDVDRIVKEGNLKAQQRPVEITTDKVYISQKIPFAFDYSQNDCDVNHTNGNSHGSHCAGTVLGNNGKDFKGIAPDAQLVVGKVFASGGASTPNILAAMEDAMILGVDSINMSLGSNAGFTNEGDDYLNDVYARVRASGCDLAVAQGNDYSAAYNNEWGLNLNRTRDIDNAIGGSPGSYPTSLTVGAIHNTMAYSIYFEVDGEKYMYEDTTADVTPEMALTNFGGKSYEYVVVPGLGAPEDFEGLDLTGKFALIIRGSLTFEEKMNNAYAAGAAGVVVYNNQPGAIRMQISSFPIPAVSVLNSIGLAMIATDNKVITIPSEPDWIYNTGAGTPTDFSSWGVSPDFKLKPDMAGPGGNIYSAVDGNKYELMSGTSMATPHVAGAMAVLAQYMNEQYPEIKDGDRSEFINRLLMSTAVPSIYEEDIPYSPRKQGAGLLSVSGALMTRAYLTVDDNFRPVVNLGSDKEKTGEYVIKFNVVNFGDKALSYDIKTKVFTELAVLGYKAEDAFGWDVYFMGETPYDLTNYAEITTNKANNRVTVQPGATEQIVVNVKLNDEAKKYMDTYFENGIYVDGFVYLNAVEEDSVDLSIPVIAFYGNWNQAPIVDDGIYYDDETTMGSVANSNIVGSSITGTGRYFKLGINPYQLEKDEVDFEFNIDRASLSPANKDGRFDAIDIMFTGLMRNTRTFTYTIRNAETGDIYYSRSYSFVRKSFYVDPPQYVIPAGASGDAIGTWRGSDANSKALPEGTKIYVRAEGTLDTPDYTADQNARPYWEVPVVIDNTQPDLLNCDYYLSPEGEIMMSIEFTDNRYVAYVEIQDYETGDTLAHGLFGENEIGAVCNELFNLGDTKADKVRVIIADYAMNEAQFRLPVDHDSLVMVGDANSDNVTDTADATTILRYVAKLTNLNAAQKKAADVNVDGVIDSADATLVLRYVAKLATF